MSSKIRFVEEAAQAGANVSALCRKYEISRQTGHKWIKRFKAHGYEGLDEQSRRPDSSPLITAEDLIAALLVEKAKHPRWGARKLQLLLMRRFGEHAPKERTVARILKRFDLVRRRRKRRGLSVVERAPHVVAAAPNDVWTIDFKGWWRTADGARCNPLTVRDALSRYVLAVELLPRCGVDEVREVMVRLFRRCGVPKTIQCDNGPPFISVQAAAGLSKLSAWWVSLGIQIVRSRLASPQDNGAHERMHVDLAGDLQAIPAATRPLQQRACSRWRQEFNHVRPHDALKGKTPADVYRASPTRPRVLALPYPPNWKILRIMTNGSIRINGEARFISTALSGYYVGLESLQGFRYRVWLYAVELCEVESAPSVRTISRLAS